MQFYTYHLTSYKKYRWQYYYKVPVFSSICPADRWTSDFSHSGPRLKGKTSAIIIKTEVTDLLETKNWRITVLRGRVFCEAGTAEIILG